MSLDVDERVDRLEQWRGKFEARLVRIETATTSVRETVERMANAMQMQAQALDRMAGAREARAVVGRWARWAAGVAVVVGSYVGGRFT